MPLVIPAVAGALAVAGLIGIVVGLTPAPVRQPTPGARKRTPLAARLARISRRTRILLALGLAAGIAVWLITGWVIAIAVGPAAAAGLPVLLSAPGSAEPIAKLEALEEWTRALAGILTAGGGLEQAITTSVRSAPVPIRPAITALVARLRARTSTETALRAFADDIDDATGDMVASYLILGSRRRGQALSAVLNSLAESVAADVRARRAIEADRAKPRATARWVTVITISVMAVLVFTGDYIRPYSTPVGQILLAVYLAAYVALLVWLRNTAKGKRTARFIGVTARATTTEGAR